MPAMQLRQAVIDQDRDSVRELWGDYLRWVNDQLEVEYGFRLDVEEILEQNMLDVTPFEPPSGRLFLAEDDGVPVGVGCLKQIRPDTGGLKRMYVRPEARGHGLGRTILARLLQEAADIGYEQVLLDSTRFMHAAHALYRSEGFSETDPYPESEIPPDLQKYWLFMHRRM